MIAIKNLSGKIGDRFSFRNRSAILRSKSIREFHFRIDPRLKTGLSSDNTDGAKDRDLICTIDPRFEINRIVIEKLLIAIRISF